MPKVESLDNLRAEVQRKLAAKIDLGTPDQAPEVERIVIPKTERPRMDNLRAEVQKTATVRVQPKSSYSPGFRRWRITPSRIALVCIALLAGGLAAFLATQRDQAAPQPVVQPAAKIVAAPTTQVLVAKAAIGIGQRLSPATVGWEEWPQGAVLPQYITLSADPQGIAEVSDEVVRSDVLAGEPIRKEKLAKADQGFLSAVLENGMRGVSVSVTAESASGGFVAPNDHVDVVMTRTAGGQVSSETILHDVTVLAINDRLGDATGTTATATDARVFSAQAIATLELDPSQAEVIINAATLGKLSLVLVSLDDYAKADVAAQRSADEAIRLSSPFWSK